MKIKDKDIVAIKEILEKILVFLGVKVNIIEKAEGNLINFNLSSKDSGILIGYRGDNLQALQYIVNLLAKNKLGEEVYIVLDIANYKKDKDKRLEDFAKNIAQKVKKTQKSEILRPMNSYERRVVHLVLSEISGIITESIGEDPNRRIIVKTE